VAATAGRRPRPTVDELRFPQNLFVSMVARRQEPGAGARRFSFGSGVDSEFSREVVQNPLWPTPVALLAGRKLSINELRGDQWHISSKPTFSPANFRFGRQNGRDRERSPLSPRRPSRIDIKPCDTLTHTSVEPLGSARFCVAVRTCMTGAHQFCDASPPEDSIES